MGDPIPPVRTGDRDADQVGSLCKAVRFLEKTLAVYHDQWLNFFDFWPEASRD